ncbi:MAG: aldehyde ferredoxin oxidoreductase N-terminal domain-containing protein, partial [Promethearchaeota archaeon]
MDSNNEIYGYSGKLLSIDLNKEKISPIPLNLKICKEFIGGAGYSCRYLIENIERQNDGLDQNNILIIMTGPFTLSGIPASNRFVVCARSPYTELWGEANCGGSFGPELKKAGYDGIIIKGKSKAPVLLFIE